MVRVLGAALGVVVVLLGDCASSVKPSVADADAQQGSCDCLRHGPDTCNEEATRAATGDLSRARKLWACACDHDVGPACSQLGWAMYKGAGGPRDLEGAAATLQKACRISRDEKGCVVLGYFYETGTVVPQDYARAAELYGHACELGEAEPCVGLGDLYARGLGVPRNVETARKLYERACAHGARTGCNRVKALDAAPAAASPVPTGT